MNDPASPPSDPASVPPGKAVLFAAENQPGNRPGEQTGRNGLPQNIFPWIIAVIAIAVIVAIVLALGGHRGSSTTTATVNPYAAQLAIGNLQLSQATNFAGDQLTYVDGTIANHGNRTVTGITVRVLFANDDGEQSQAEQLPLNLIRTRQPYVDTEPVHTAPLKPGASQDFRLIFDDISPLWNQQIPAVKILNVTTQP